jgi:soluble lytic murein transglycosylase-like protein
MAMPTSSLAAELTDKTDATVSVEVALQWRDIPALPDVAPERLGNQKLQSLAEEASKQAQVKYLAKKLRKSPSTVRKYVNLAWEEADKRDGLEPELLIAIMQKESSLSPKVQSRYGAQGLMQVVRRWHRDKLRPSESLLDPEVNIRVGADILEEYLELAGGSLPEALDKYSGNPQGYANTVLKESRKLARVADQAAAKVEASQG